MEQLAIVFTIAIVFGFLALIVKQNRSSSEEPLTLAESIRRKIARAAQDAEAHSHTDVSGGSPIEEAVRQAGEDASKQRAADEGAGDEVLTLAESIRSKITEAQKNSNNKKTDKKH